MDVILETMIHSARMHGHENRQRGGDRRGTGDGVIEEMAER